MKICVINNLYPPYNRGGAEIVAANQVKEFLAQGHDVFVISTKPLFKSITLPQKADYKIYRFYPLNIFSIYHIDKFSAFLRAIWRIFDIFNLHAYFKIKKILTKEKPDIVHMHNLTGLGYLIPRLIKKFKIKYIQTMHDVFLVRPSGLLIYAAEKETCLIKIYTQLTRFLFNSPAEVHFPSDWLKKYYQQHKFFSHSQKQVIRNFKLQTQNLLLNKKLKNPKHINFLYIGQIEQHKGILFLIQAFSRFSISKYQLNIIGSGSQLQLAKKLAGQNPNIFFQAYQPQHKIKQFLNQADYLILPSLCYENSPTVIFESLQAKVPVIAPNLGGIPELIQPNQNGYLFSPNNPKSLIQVLKNAIIKL